MGFFFKGEIISFCREEVINNSHEVIFFLESYHKTSVLFSDFQAEQHQLKLLEHHFSSL